MDGVVNSQGFFTSRKAGSKMPSGNKNPDVTRHKYMMYESVTNPRSAPRGLAPPARQESGFDYYSIMAYHKQMSDELGKDTSQEINRLIEDLASEAVEIAGGAAYKVLMGYQTADWTHGESIDYGEVTELARRIEAKGVSMAVMPYIW